MSALFPHSTKLLRTRPLEAMVVGAFVRGLSMRDVESLCEEAGLGKLSKSTASRICGELRERFEAFKRRDLYEGEAGGAVPRRDLPQRQAEGPEGGRAVRLGLHRGGRAGPGRGCLGMRESHEDWLGLGRDLIARGLGAPMLIVADGAPGLIKAVEQCWPASDRQHCSVHRARNLIAKLPERDRERVRRAYWQALDEAKDERDGKRAARGPGRRAREGRLHLRREMPRRRPRRARRPPALPAPAPQALALDQPARANARRGEAKDQGDRPVPRRGELPLARLGGPRPPDQQRLQRGQALRDRPPTALPAPATGPANQTNPRR